MALPDCRRPRDHRLEIQRQYLQMVRDFCTNLELNGALCSCLGETSCGSRAGAAEHLGPPGLVGKIQTESCSFVKLKSSRKTIRGYRAWIFRITCLTSNKGYFMVLMDRVVFKLPLPLG
jgi:hypothetical protein